jgi:hypothetical protein
LNDAVNSLIKEPVHDVLHGAINTSDMVSDGAAYVAAISAMTIPFTGPEGAKVAGGAFKVGTGADVVSLALKAIDTYAFDGPIDELKVQAMKVMLSEAGGRAITASTARFARTTSGGARAEYRAGSLTSLVTEYKNGQFIPSAMGRFTSAVSDATKVEINLRSGEAASELINNFETKDE